MVGHRYSSLCDLVHMPCSLVVDAAVIELELRTPADFTLHKGQGYWSTSSKLVAHHLTQRRLFCGVAMCLEAAILRVTI